MYLSWTLIEFSPFSASVVCLFFNKMRICNKARFLLNTLKNTPSSGKSLIGKKKGGGRLFEFEWAGRGGGVGAYSRWALIRGWALIQINTVF